MTKRTPLKAIRAKCLDCTNNQNNEIRDCPIVQCPLYDFRMGHNPNRKGICGKGFAELGKKGKDTEGEEIIDETELDGNT